MTCWHDGGELLFFLFFSFLFFETKWGATAELESGCSSLLAENILAQRYLLFVSH
jgi:hypothetical protein